MSRRVGLVMSLSMRDLAHERRLTVCSIAGLAAVLAPLILLFGLKNGLIQGLRADLIENPRTRMIVNAANRSFDDAFMARLSARPDVAFVTPRLRTLNNEARFERPDKLGVLRRAELLASGPGDPLLGALPPPADLDVVVSAPLAERLDLQSGGPLLMRLLRAKDTELLTLTLRVRGIAPLAAFDRDGVFVSRPLLFLADDFLDGKLPPGASLQDSSREPRTYAGFRAHARRLEDVPVIDRDLRARDVDVETRAVEVAGLLGLESSLNLLFALLASLGAAGFLVSLGVGLYANVERKQRELSLLRLIGLMRGSLMLVPIFQAAIVALIGALTAAGTALVGSVVLNRVSLIATAASGHPLCVIQSWHLAAATAASMAGAILAAGFAGRRAAAIHPAEGLANV